MRTKRGHEEAMFHQNLAFRAYEHFSPEEIEAMRRPFLQPYCSKPKSATASPEHGEDRADSSTNGDPT